MPTATGAPRTGNATQPSLTSQHAVTLNLFQGPLCRLPQDMRQQTARAAGGLPPPVSTARWTLKQVQGDEE
ncbi:hypothetical protein GCM10017612_02020 [Novosphingobium resinovorum]|nr:hypothetical protein GCM10017612_02020 [Novosphingobium resinovorum]